MIMIVIMIMIFLSSHDFFPKKEILPIFLFLLVLLNSHAIASHPVHVVTSTLQKKHKK